MSRHLQKATVMRRTTLTLALAAATLSNHPLVAQTRHDRAARRMEESAQPKAVSGGTTFQTPIPIENGFDAVLNHLKRQGHDIELADRDAGRIVTVMETVGSHSQTGTRILVALIKDSNSQTTLRIVVTTQKRKKLLMAEPWSDAKVDDAASRKVTAEMQEALKSR